MQRRHRRLLGSAAFAALVVAGAARAAQVETFVLVVGGDSAGPNGCTTFQTPAPVGTFFGGYGPSQPLGGYAGCGIDGGLLSQTAPVGPLTDDLADSFAWDVNTASGSADVFARHGEVEANLDHAYAGTTNPQQVEGVAGFGRADDTLTITSPSWPAGQVGYVVFHLTVTGATSQTAVGGTGVEVVYFYGSVGPYTLFRVQGYYPNANPWITSATGLGLGGFTLGLGSASGSDVVPSLTHPFLFGTPFDWKFGALTYAASAISGTMDSDWHVELTGISVYGPQGQPVNDFVITSASGTAYGPDGVVDPICANGLDDDGDGAADFGADPGCRDPGATSVENPQCQDGFDNDGDGRVDFDGGAAANGGVALGPLDPKCAQPYKDKEAGSSCGLGGELVLLLALGRAYSARRTRE
jgi:hypothetical protein